MYFSNIQKAKLVLIINFVVLCLIIISTPHFIREGISIFAEEAVEAFFLTIELVALFIVFKHYDFQVKKHEEIARTLNFKLEKKERELLNALEYLGKVNVQVSMIKTLLEKTRVPSTKGQLLEVFSELLRIVCSTTKESAARLRIVNLENFRTLGEHVETLNDDEKACDLEAGNKKLVEIFKNKDKSSIGDCDIYYSDVENFSLKAFIFVPKNDKIEQSEEKRIFLEAIANQFEIVFVLFNSRYFKSK